LVLVIPKEVKEAYLNINFTKTIKNHLPKRQYNVDAESRGYEDARALTIGKQLDGSFASV